MFTPYGAIGRHKSLLYLILICNKAQRDWAKKQAPRKWVLSLVNNCGLVLQLAQALVESSLWTCQQNAFLTSQNFPIWGNLASQVLAALHPFCNKPRWGEKHASPLGERRRLGEEATSLSAWASKGNGSRRYKPQGSSTPRLPLWHTSRRQTRTTRRILPGPAGEVGLRPAYRKREGVVLNHKPGAQLIVGW